MEEWGRIRGFEVWTSRTRGCMVLGLQDAYVWVPGLGRGSRSRGFLGFEFPGLSFRGVYQWLGGQYPDVIRVAGRPNFCLSRGLMYNSTKLWNFSNNCTAFWVTCGHCVNQLGRLDSSSSSDSAGHGLKSLAPSHKRNCNYPS